MDTPPANPAEPPEAGIYRCPACSEPMVGGKVVLNSSATSFLFFGFSSSKLDFVRPGERHHRLLNQCDTRRAFRCRQCGIVSIIPPRGGH